MKCSRHTIQLTIKRLRETRRTSGRKRKTTARQDRYLERLALEIRFQTPKQLAADLSVEQDVSVCDRTVRRRLAKMFGTPGAQLVRRRPEEAFRADFITPTVKHGGGSIMI
ncbi:hypothetical protein Trydic_g5351 [Trypoxylus dichotomus]